MQHEHIESKTSSTRDTNNDSAPLADEDLTEEQRALIAKGDAARVQWVTSRRDFRARAHSNPLNDGNFKPPSNHVEYQNRNVFGNNRSVQWVDIGCGYGGLLASLSAAFPDVNMLGLEIRDRVAAYCNARAKELGASNLAFERTNAMKYLPHYFGRGQLEKMFFCYPDPHFKKRKNRQRIVSTALLAEYAYILRVGGVAYVVTDVVELYEWMVQRFEAHPLFERRDDAVHRADVVAPFIRDYTDEAQRVANSDRPKLVASFVRLPNPEVK